MSNVPIDLVSLSISLLPPAPFPAETRTDWAPQSTFHLRQQIARESELVFGTRKKSEKIMLTFAISAFKVDSTRVLVRVDKAAMLSSDISMLAYTVIVDVNDGIWG